MAIHAPDLPTDAVWLNVERPLTPADLRGRVLAIDAATGSATVLVGGGTAAAPG